jgi:hypothetical protein
MLSHVTPIPLAERRAVIDAFTRAAAGGLDRAQCYGAAADALQRLYPDTSTGMVARRATSVLTVHAASRAAAQRNAKM